MSALPGRILCLVTDIGRAGGEEAMLRATGEAVRGGVNMVQVRAHELDESAFALFASAVVTLVKEVDEEVIVVVNGPSQVAVDSGADGIHLRERLKLNRNELPHDLLAGQSVHSLRAARQAQEDGADYIVLGTVFPSGSHPGGETGGTALVSSVTQAIDVPVIGIGGITAENTCQVIAAGAAGVAVIGAIIGADNPFDAARALSAATGAGKKR